MALLPNIIPVKGIGAAGGIALLLAGCAASVQPVAQLKAPAPSDYVIGSEDELAIHFTYNPSFDQTIPVQHDGRVALPMVGQIPVAGATPQQLAVRLTDLYDAYLQHPEVVVTVKNAVSRRVFITGEVGRSGVIALDPEMTVAGAISAAGGLKDTAGAKKVLLFRRDAAGTERAYRIDLASVVAGGDMSQNVPLAPRDVIYVPKSDLAEVNVFMQQLLRNNIPVGLGAGL